jgi:hypothetical protein
MRRALTTTTTLAMTLLILSGTAPSEIRPAYAQMREPPTQELLKKLLEKESQLEQRDAVIRDLVQRVQRLEQAAGDTAPSAAPAATGRPPPTTVQAAGKRAPARTAPQPGGQQAQGPAAPTPPPPPSPASSTQPREQSSVKTAPGQFEVDEQAAERALERTLVATGALLVPYGFAEVEPAFGYARRENTTQIFFGSNRNELMGSVNARIGLPLEAQFELGIPYNIVEQQLVNNAALPPQQVFDRWGSSFGDLTVGVAKSILHEKGWMPDLLGRITYNAPTGPASSNHVPLLSHQSKLSPSLTAVKRQDPLVFVAGGGYTHAFEVDGITPGDQLNFLGGAFLAASPETTLRTVFQQQFTGDLRVASGTLAGSNTVQSQLTFGASSILGRGLLVDLQASIGLTKDTPKYAFILSFPFRFPVPVP